MEIKKWMWVAVSLTPLAIVIKWLGSSFPSIVETWYSTSVNRVFIQVWSRMTGMVPFSIHELLIILMIIGGVIYIIKKGWKQSLIAFLAFGSIGYFLFVLLWGLNYERISFAETAGLNKGSYTIEDVEVVYERLVKEANELRKQVPEDERGVFIVPEGSKWVFQEAQKGYDVAAEMYPTLSGIYGKPKGILASPLMSYTGITGVYAPYTGEANVNISVPDVTMVFTTMHEMAHQRGYTSEDEANFIGYLTCSLHPDPLFQYAGALAGLTYTRNAIARVEPERLDTLTPLSDDVKRDMIDKQQFWAKYEGPVDTISTKVNDTFLKANGVSEGVASYGKMVDLLLSYFNKGEM